MKREKKLPIIGSFFHARKNGEAPQGYFCHQTKVTKNWLRKPWFLRISFPQILWLISFPTGAEETGLSNNFDTLSRLHCVR